MVRARWSGLAGILFVVLLLAGQFLSGAAGVNPVALETLDAPELATLVRGQQQALVTSAFLFSLAGVALLWFAGGLYWLLRQHEGEPGPWSLVAFAGGALWAFLLFLNGLLLDQARGFADEPAGARTVLGLASGLIFSVPALLLPVSLVGAAAMVARRAPVLPRWLGWGGWVVAALLGAGSALTIVEQPFPVLPLGVLLVLGWVLATSVALLRWSKPNLLAAPTTGARA